MSKLGVTVVAANYRVGAFGFLNHPALGANFGILDQIAALRWIQDNIDAFGGDPTRVLLFGYSAGAVNIRALLQSPLAKDLFSRCVLQSGGGENPTTTETYSSTRSQEATRTLLGSLGSTDIDTLRLIPAERIVAAAFPLSGVAIDGPRTPFDLVWRPIPDGEIVQDATFPAWRPDLPVMFSSCQNEARYFIDPARTYTSSQVEAMAYKLSGHKSTEILSILNSEVRSPLEQLDYLVTSVVWSEPAYASLQRFSSEGHPVYYYRFARLAPGSAKSKRLVFHGSDVYYVFGNLIDREYDDRDRRISEELQHVYVEFAKTGIPRGEDGVAWPRFQPETSQSVLVSDEVWFSSYPLRLIDRVMYAVRKSSSE